MSGQENCFAEVYVNVPLEHSFTYRIPKNMPVKQFCRVEVNFNNRTMMGFVIGIHKNKPENVEETKIKEISKLIDNEPIFDERLYQLAMSISHDYLCSPGEAFAMMLPSAKTPSRRFKNPLPNPSKDSVILSDEQQTIFQKILEGKDKKSLLHLVYGITGSGKTELYIALARALIQKGFSVIYCVPEISLSSQIYERLYDHFGDEMVLYHSGLTPPQRLYSWLKFYRGESKIAVGTRSAIFMQCPRLGMIIIDEEHDVSYKEHSTPRYNARRVALNRAKNENALLVLGSATPSVESLYAAERGIFALHKMVKRYGNATLPSIEIIDISSTLPKEHMLSNELKIGLKKIQEKNEQAILLLNRRGFSPIVMCQNCHKAETCPHCSISLTFHRNNMLLCHYCGFSKPYSERCSSCGAQEIKKVGSGTQRIEDILPLQIPRLRVFRLDQDTRRKKRTSFELLEKMRDGSIDVLLGTQMVAKGYDFPRVSLVGVLLADIGINMPDFRATERTFSLLMQVAGRSGRREKPGKVIIQTLNINHPIFEYLKRHDYDGFYRHELATRKELRYPPFSRIVRLLMRGKDEKKVNESITQLAAKVREEARKRNVPADILGPSPAPILKIANNYRWHLIIKCSDMERTRQVIHTCRHVISSNDVYLEIDIDPYEMM
ncbi:MAG: primosomal protein N' [Spirochaetes bacterium]|nr:primosomal protein N' [Spirochaetota bacterium]